MGVANVRLSAEDARVSALRFKRDRTKTVQNLRARVKNGRARRDSVRTERAKWKRHENIGSGRSFRSAMENAQHFAVDEMIRVGNDPHFVSVLMMRAVSDLHFVGVLTMRAGSGRSLADRRCVGAAKVDLLLRGDSRRVVVVESDHFAGSRRRGESRGARVLGGHR